MTTVFFLTHPRFLAKRVHLPQRDGEHPDIGGVRERARAQRLRRAPRERHAPPLTHHVAVVGIRQRSH